MKFFTKILLLALLAINPITSMGYGDDSNNCQAIYLPEKEILHIPCIDLVTKDGDLLKSYAVDMRLIPNTDPLQFIPQDILEISWDGMNTNCRSTYAQENGTISIPCIEVPKLSEDGDYAVGMKQMLSENSSELPKFVITNIKQQTKQVKERNERSSTRSATSFSTGSYENNQNINRTLSISGASGLEVQITGETERNYDWISIYDSNGQQVRRVSGPLNVSFTVNGSSIRVNFSSDGSITKSGATVNIRAITGNTNLSRPNLTRPANNANNVSTSGQSFNWGQVSNANTYRIVVSTTSDFGGFTDQGANSRCNNTCFTAKISSTSYRGFNLAQGTRYYWKVRAGNNSAGSNWSTTRQFTVARTIGNQTSFSTGSYENNQNINRTLSISGASGLQVQITGETEQNYDWIRIYNSNGQQVRRVSGPLNVNFTVNGSSIRVNFNSDGSVTKSGATVTIRAVTGDIRLSSPNLISPANNANNVSASGQTFNWSRVNNANTYRIVVSTISDFGGFTDRGANSICNNTCFTAKISSTSYRGFNLAQGTSYYWRVRAGNNSTASNWSTTRQFTVARSTGNQTSFSTGRYENNQNINRTLAISGASSLQVQITGETERNYDWISIYDSNGQQVRRVSGPLNVSFMVNGSSIRVNFNSDGSITKRGAIVTISRSTVNTDPLPAPRLINPSNGATNVSQSNPSYSWQSVSGATTYRIVVSQQSDFSGYSESTRTCNSTCFTTTTNSTSINQPLRNANFTYYWKVRAGNSNTGGLWSETSSFRTTGTNSFPSSASVDSFVQNKTGTCTDMDGRFGCQCVDLMHSYIQDVLGVPRSAHSIRGNAFPIYNGLANSTTISSGRRTVRLNKVQNTPTGVPQKGDIIFWRSTNGNRFGHVAIFIDGNVNNFRSLDQNWGVNANEYSGLPAARINHDYNNVVGWLHPVLISN